MYQFYEWELQRSFTSSTNIVNYKFKFWEVKSGFEDNFLPLQGDACDEADIN